RPGVLHQTGYVAIGLLRGTRVGVLTKGLRLAADLNPRDRARTHIGAEHQPVSTVDVVVDAQRVKARALEYRKISDLRRKCLIGGRSRDTWAGWGATGWET